MVRSEEYVKKSIVHIRLTVMSQQVEIELDIVDLMAHPHQRGTQDYLEPLGKLCKSDL